MYEDGARQIERVRDLKPGTYHAVDNDDVRRETTNFSSNVISRALAKQGWYRSFFPGLLKSNS